MSGGWRTWRVFGSWADRLEVLAPLVTYALMVVTGLTTSSLGLLRVRPADTSVPDQVGDALAIRSDEWLTATPIELATLANGSSMTSPLANGPDLIYQVSSGSPVESLFFTEGTLLRLGAWLPDEMLFAAFRAYPWLLLALFLPPLLRRLGANRPMSWLAVALCLLAPAAIWWSFIPIRILGLAAAGCYLLVLATDRVERRHHLLGIPLAVLAGMLLARQVTYYVPWSLTTGVPLILATGLFLVLDRERRRAALVAIGVGAACALLLLVGVFWENWAALHAELNTLYPGQRRSTGAAQLPFELFGAPGLFEIEGLEAPLGTNQSEASSAYLVSGLVALALWPAVRARVSTPEKGAMGALAGATVLFAAWSMFDWGPLGESVPLLSSLMPSRTAQTVGFPATLLMCLVVSAWARSSEAEAEAGPEAEAGTGPDARRVRRRRALQVAVVVGVVTAYAVSDLKNPWPGMPSWQVWTAVAVTTALMWAFVRHPRHWVPVVAAVVVSLLAFADANPLTFGLGDLRNSPAAERARGLRDVSIESRSRMVTDSMGANALLVANGVPMLSGYQVTGPVREQWEVLDPEGDYELVWNRGASYLLFAFDKPEGAAPEVIEEGFDVIRVHTDACWLAESPWRVERLVSEAGIASRCAKQVGTIAWNGTEQKVYRLRSS